MGIGCNNLRYSRLLKGDLFCRHMAPLSLFFIMAAFLIAAPSGLIAQWERTARPPAKAVGAFSSSDSILYVGSEDRGIFTSTDDGSTWIANGLGLVDTAFFAIA